MRPVTSNQIAKKYVAGGVNRNTNPQYPEDVIYEPPSTNIPQNFNQFPPMGFQFKSRTELGLKHMFRGMILFGFLLFFIILVVISVFGFGVISLMIGFSAFVTLIGMLVSWVLGFLNMHRGRWEFGPVHKHNVNLSIMFALLFIFIFIAQFAVSVLFWRIIMDSNLSFFLFRLWIGIFSSLAISLSWIFLIKELASSGIKILLWISLGLNIVLSSIINLVGLGPRFLNIVGFMSWYFVIVIVLFCYYEIYNGIKKKKLIPIFPPPIPPPMYPPMPPP